MNEALSALQTGSSYPAVRDSDVRSMPLPLAPMAEQERIVAAIEERLSHLDAAGLVRRRGAAWTLRAWLGPPGLSGAPSLDDGPQPLRTWNGCERRGMRDGVVWEHTKAGHPDAGNPFVKVQPV